MAFSILQHITIKNDSIIAENEEKVSLVSSASVNQSVAEYCQYLCNYGADALFIDEISNDDETHDKNIDTVKEIVTMCDKDVYLGGNIKRLEDVKKYLYAGAICAMLDLTKESNVNMLKEACDRFGADKIAVLFDETVDAAVISQSIEYKVHTLFAKNIKAYSLMKNKAKNMADYKVIVCGMVSDYELIYEVYETSDKKINGVVLNMSPKVKADYMDIKESCADAGIDVSSINSSITFSELTLNNDGLIPVIVQDYKTDEILMLAYMNNESFDYTLKTGRMTYYSRSRQEIWEKGLTSGHFQYVKEMTTDCDKDTLLAKVFQVGAACHTGNRSCFFNDMFKLDYKENNPHKVLEDVYKVILDRKANPKEGSYTNYLFDKGIDKILKKCGEEAAEIIIAAKNPNKEEIKYEISDFLYHVMVLMAEKGVTWEDIMVELSRR